MSVASINQSINLSIGPNNGATDNLILTPGQAVYLQLSRGATTTVPNYRVVLCLRDANGGLQIDRDLAKGADPDPQNPTNDAPFVDLGVSDTLAQRSVVAVLDGIPLPPNVVGLTAVVAAVFELTAANTYRRVATSSIQARTLQLDARFQINLT